MVTVLGEQVEPKKKKPGRPSKLSVEDQVLIPHFLTNFANIIAQSLV